MEFAPILEHQQRTITYFADSSKNDLGTGCAVVINLKVLYRCPLTSTVSVLTAELFAILLVLQHMHMSKYMSGDICTDALSVIQSLILRKKLSNIIP